jgi:hypothetical protein
MTKRWMTGYMKTRWIQKVWTGQDGHTDVVIVMMHDWSMRQATTEDIIARHSSL